MVTYTLNVVFTNDQLDTIFETNSRIVIAKPLSGAEPNVAWQSFNPFQNNTITWNEAYGIYISNSKIVNGAFLDKLSTVPSGAAMDKLYTLKGSGVITGPDEGGATNSFALLNAYRAQPYINVGLYQDAMVNAIDSIGNANSVVPVLSASTALMTPNTILYLWVQSNVEANTVVTPITAPLTQLQFGGGVSGISVSYDTDSGRFLSIQE